MNFNNIFKTLSHRDIFLDELRQEHIKDKGCYYLDMKKSTEQGVAHIYEDGEVIDTIAMDNDVYNSLFARRDDFKVELREDGYYVIRFVDFHSHSAYSILDGMSTIDGLANSIEYCGALTDHGNMFGFYKFYKAMKKRGKKPIIGFEAYVTRHQEGDVKLVSKSRAHVVILCKDEVGYNNAIKLTTLGYIKGHKTKKTVRPAITYEDLFAHKEGLIVTSACMGGDIPKYIEQGHVSEAEKLVIRMKEEFGDDFYLEIQRHGIENEEKVNFNLIALARKHNIKIVAGVDSHYINKEDKHSQEVLLANNRKTTMSDPNRWIFPGDRYYKMSSTEMVELFADIPEALDNTLEIADKITYEIPKTTYRLPKFDIPDGFEDEYSYLVSICRQGMDEKGFTGNPEYEERLEFELDVIKRMGYSSYFLIVWDFIFFAKSNGILVGPGRGSACGSIVAYTMKITDVDPIRYGLLFERFLSPDRVSMPDVDIDFQDDRREEVIEYVRRKYGEECVSNIITYGSMKSKSAIRDVARIYDHEPAFGDRIAKLVPDKVKNLKCALEESEEFSNMYNANSEVKAIVDTAITIEGLPKSTGKHACGVIIAPEPITNFIPQVVVMDETGEKDEKGSKVYEEVMVTQLDMAECEEMGLLKMDFLGLRNLSVIAGALELINKNRLVEGLPLLTMDDIPITDPYAFKHIQQGNTIGVFQLESGGMTNLVSETYPDVDNYIKEYVNDKKVNEKGIGVFDERFDPLFERLIALISLYRPGPMDEIPNYLHNMNNPDDVTYDAPQLKDILSNTYGIIVYQEQVMHAVRQMAGFSAGQSDVIRKAMGKKIEYIVDEYGEYFIYGSEESDKKRIREGQEPYNIKGCINNGISEEVAKETWDKMYKFAKYALR